MEAEFEITDAQPSNHLRDMECSGGRGSGKVKADMY